MRVLVACEFSGVVRRAFRARGHDAWSCDFEPAEDGSKYHFQQDVFTVLNRDWDLMIAHPPCTYLTVTGNKWMKPEFRSRFPTREQDRLRAIEFFLACYNVKVPRIAVENPVGIISTIFRKPDQYIHPYYFGDAHSKKTGLWLKGLPKLQPTNVVAPLMYTYKDGRKDPMWHVESLGMDAKERAKHRNRTFQGIAEAMAEQWGSLS